LHPVYAQIQPARGHGAFARMSTTAAFDQRGGQRKTRKFL
jgi:hypothetical protein